MTRWSLVLLVTAALVALLAAHPVAAPIGLAARWAALSLVLVALGLSAVAVHRRKAFERGLHLWSTPSQQYKP